MFTMQLVNVEHYFVKRSKCLSIWLWVWFVFFLFFLVLSLSHVWLFVTPRTAHWQASLSFTISWSFLKLMYTKSVMSSNHLLIYRPLLLPWIIPSIRIFSKELAFRIRWPKYWNFNFSISHPSEYSGLISFRIDWFDLLAVQWSLKSLQHQSSKASVQGLAFFMVQLSHPYMTTGKTIALTRWIFVGKVMSLLFNMLSRLVIAFFPRSKHLNFMAAVTVFSDFGLFCLPWWLLIKIMIRMDLCFRNITLVTILWAN